MSQKLNTTEDLKLLAEEFKKANSFLNKIFPTRKITKVLLVNPPDSDSSLFRFDTARRKRYANYPPYGLAVLAKNLQKNSNVEVKICNLNHEILLKCIEAENAESFRFDSIWMEKLDYDIDEFKPDLVGVTCMFTMTHTSFYNICERVSQKSLPIAIGGVHVSNDVEHILDDVPFANFAFLNESDISFKDFVNIVNKKEKLENLGQVIFNNRDDNDRLRFLNQVQPTSEEIDIIPAYDLIDLKNYTSNGTIGNFYFLKPAGSRFATVLSNRGCRAHCTFCSVRNFNGFGVRQRSIYSVVDELEILQNEYGIEHIMWLDDDLYKNDTRAISLFNEMVKRKLKLTWDATNGVIANSCTQEIIAASAESGCIALSIGMESGNPSILKAIQKPGTVKSFLKAAEVLKQYEKIHANVNIIIGFPNETMSMILDTLNVARTMDLDWYRIQQLQPLPNTPIYDSMIAQGLLKASATNEVRYSGGSFGKQTEIEQGLRMATARFEDAFSGITKDSIPTGNQLTDIWFYLNYHLNFHRLFTETRSIKIDQQMKGLVALSDIISPENGFALYFLGYLQYKQYGKIEPPIMERLRKQLTISPYWNDRFVAFGLSYEDLVTKNFLNKDISRIIAGKINDEETYLE